MQAAKSQPPDADSGKVFGRYAFLKAGSGDVTFRVGDNVQILRRNAERTVMGMFPSRQP